MRPELIVSRHQATIDYLQKVFAGPPGTPPIPVKAQATEKDVVGKTVAGNLPLWLAHIASAVISVEFTNPPRGREFSMEEMIDAGVSLRGYTVTLVHPDIRSNYPVE